MSSLYDKELAICQKYFSNDAKRFLDRQINSHLNKDPEAIEPGDKAELGKWCKISGALLIGPDKATQLSQEILAA